MDAFGCDYACRTVGESIAKYMIPDDWFAEFDACDDVCPIIVIQVDQIRKTPAMMELKLKFIENPDDKYAGCMVRIGKNVIAFKVNRMCDLVKATESIFAR